METRKWPREQGGEGGAVETHKKRRLCGNEGFCDGFEP